MPNHLAEANSLYLRKHAENPIDWWYWCDEALEMAQRQDKPIFLSVGYSSCHWCTVMEGEAFSDATIAEYVNANFLPIKVDREERPDLDSIYMQSLQMMIGQGGWPLNIFLTPGDLVPFYGGTYFSVEPRYGRPSFLQVLEGVRRFYDQEKEKLRSLKAEVLHNLHQSVELPPVEMVSCDVLMNGLEYNTGIVSAKSTGASFPMIPYAEVALRSRRFTFERYDAAEISMQRGLDLALGGIFDQVGGGFHRYTVDPTWTVPHFEKMLYDNGQIMEYLANLWSAGVQEPALERAIARTVEWLQREMTAPAGYFYAAQDADSFTTPDAIEPEEGAFYVWSFAELSTLFSEAELAQLQAQFTITQAGNFEGMNVLQRHHSGLLDGAIETTLAQLFQIRYGIGGDRTNPFPPARNNHEAKETLWPGRIPPVTDTKMIVAWNSLMISGLARAATVFQQPAWLSLAVNAANFILSQQWVNDRFHRVNYDGLAHVLAQSEDYALFIKALIDLDQASLAHPPTHSPTHPPFLSEAVKIQAEFDEYLWSADMGGYFNTDRCPDLLIRERSYMDNATPAANGVAVSNLVRLALLTEDLRYLDRAEQTLKAFGTVLQASPQASPSLFSGLDWFLHPTLVRATSATIATIAPQYHPTAIYKLQSDLPADRVGLVCQGLLCRAPSPTLEHLLEQLTQSQLRSVRPST